MKERIRKILTRIFFIVTAGAFYALFYARTGIGIPCPLRYFTGLKCPGCGVTRMCLSLLRGDFAAAWKYNAVLLCVLPFLLFLLCWIAYCYIKTGSVRYPRIVNILLYAIIIALLVFFVVRNITEHHFMNLFLRIKNFL